QQTGYVLPSSTSRRNVLMNMLNRGDPSVRQGGTAMSSGNSQKGTRMTIMAIEGLVGFAAVIAGLLLMVRPDGSLLGMSKVTLSATGFSDYLVPGVLLVVLVGGGTLIAAVGVGLRTRNAAEI